VLGATGLVGRHIVEQLEVRDFPLDELVLLASDRGPAGRRMRFAGRDLEVRVARAESFDGVDLVLSSAGREAARALLPEAVRRGAVVVDNSSAFRMEPDVPLVVPEVNPEAIGTPPRGIVANPNCTTIQVAVALKPLLDAAGLRRVVVASYQSVSGAGARAVEAWRTQGRERLALDAPAPAAAVPAPRWDDDCLPWIGGAGEDEESEEETKIRREICKILGRSVPVHATCVRVPVERGHGVAAWIETEEPLDPCRARRVLAAAPGIVVADGTGPPTPRGVVGDGRVHVGRIRRDPSCRNGLAMWIAADNLLKGAALNAVQIAEVLAGGRAAPALAAGGGAG
jgi:aspartate-semialdehyde dehydrogenase